MSNYQALYYGNSALKPQLYLRKSDIEPKALNLGYELVALTIEP